MSSWSHVDVKAARSDWIEHSPWTVDVMGVVHPVTTAHIPLGSEIIYAEPAGSPCQDLEVIITIPGETPVTTCGSYSVLDGTVTHRSPGMEDGQPVEVLVVSSMVVLQDDDPQLPKKEWHLSGLTVKGDPQDTAVIGAQGTGG